MSEPRLRTDEDYRTALLRLEGFGAVGPGHPRYADYEALLTVIDLWEEQHEGIIERPQPSDRQ